MKRYLASLFRRIDGHPRSSSASWRWPSGLASPSGTCVGLWPSAGFPTSSGERGCTSTQTRSTSGSTDTGGANEALPELMRRGRRSTGRLHRGLRRSARSSASRRRSVHRRRWTRGFRPYARAVGPPRQVARRWPATSSRRRADSHRSSIEVRRSSPMLGARPGSSSSWLDGPQSGFGTEGCHRRGRGHQASPGAGRQERGESALTGARSWARRAHRGRCLPR